MATRPEPKPQKPRVQRLPRCTYKGAYHACKWCNGVGCLACETERESERKKDNAKGGGHKARPNEGARA